MSLNDIQLPASVVAALYPHSLIQEEAASAGLKAPITTIPAIKQEVTEPGWKYLGNNRKNILVVVKYTDSLYLPDEELNFLTRMLTACKLDLGDVAIVNVQQHKGAVAKDFLGFFKSKTVFLFGIDPVAFGLPVSFPHYQVQTVAHITYLYVPALEERHKDELLKSKLWVSLKRIFGI